MKFTHLGSWLYRVRFDDGTAAVVDARAERPKPDQFRVPESEIAILRNRARQIAEEIRALTTTKNGNPRKRYDAEHVANLEKERESMRPLADEYNAFHDYQNNVVRAHQRAAVFYNGRSRKARILRELQERGLEPGARAQFKPDRFGPTIEGTLWLRGDYLSLSTHIGTWSIRHIGQIYPIGEPVPIVPTSRERFGHLTGQYVQIYRNGQPVMAERHRPVVVKLRKCSFLSDAVSIRYLSSRTAEEVAIGPSDDLRPATASALHTNGLPVPRELRQTMKRTAQTSLF